MAPATKQLYYDAIEVGTEIPALQKRPNYTQLFKYSAVVRNDHRIHYDQAYARTEDLPDILVQGTLQGAFVAQVITDWIGAQGWIKKITYSSRGMALPGDVLTLKGKVTRKWEESGEHLVECEVSEVNQRGEVLVPGSVIVALPCRT